MKRNKLVEMQRHRNETTRAQWEAMKEHRGCVMNLLKQAAPIGGSLALLGAGNTNDIDFVEIAEHYASVTLIDIDAEAIEMAAARVPADRRHIVHCVGGVDVTGILESLMVDGRSLDDLQAIISQAASVRAPSESEYDVVASTCLMSQLVDSVTMVVPEEHSQFVELVLTVRNRHLEHIAELLSPGGMGILISDFVGTETAPELATIDSSQLAQAAQRWINERNFFTGCNPKAVYQFLLESSDRLGIDRVTVKRPWRWDLGARMFAVFAAVFGKQ